MNATTQEQSKQLLALGLPANSADCYSEGGDGFTIDCNPWPYFRNPSQRKDKQFFEHNATLIPCWSVGELIIIWMKCYIFDAMECDIFYFSQEETSDLVGSMVERFAFGVKCKKLDFSKIEL